MILETHTVLWDMLGQGCLGGALFEEQFISTESGVKMGFCQRPEMGSRVCKSGFWGAEVPLTQKL